MMTFMQYDDRDAHAQAIDRWREACIASTTAREPGPPLLQDFTYCHEDADEAKAIAHEYISRYFLSVIKHYDFAGSHWRETRATRPTRSGRT